MYKVEKLLSDLESAIHNIIEEKEMSLKEKALAKERIGVIIWAELRTFIVKEIKPKKNAEKNGADDLRKMVLWLNARDEHKNDNKTIKELVKEFKKQK
jgi:hypothetical protein